MGNIKPDYLTKVSKILSGEVGLVHLLRSPVGAAGLGKLDAGGLVMKLTQLMWSGKAIDLKQILSLIYEFFILPSFQ